MSKSARDPAAYRRNEIVKLRRGEGVDEYNLLQVAPNLCSVVRIDTPWRPTDRIPARWVGHIIAELEELDGIVSQPASTSAPAPTPREWTDPPDGWAEILSVLSKFHWLGSGNTIPWNWIGTYGAFSKLFNFISPRLSMKGNQEAPAFFLAYFLKSGKKRSAKTVRNGIKQGKTPRDWARIKEKLDCP
jgi:hypothetical protein